MIITVACTKGGAGKSTIVTNLAVAAVHRQGAGAVAIVDADIQKTATYWQEKRAEKPSLAEVPCFHCVGLEVYNKILEVGQQFKTVFVDAGGRASTEFQIALAAADRVLVPVQPSAADGMALDDTLQALERVSQQTGNAIEAISFLSRASTNPKHKDSREMIDYLRQVSGLRVVEERTRDRNSYREALAQGRGVVELGASGETAAEELIALYQAVAVDGATTGRKGARKHG